MDSVESSFVDSVGYDELGKRLVVRFKSGSIYKYQGVPKDIYLGFMEDESKGRFYSKHIRGKYESKQLWEETERDDMKLKSVGMQYRANPNEQSTKPQSSEAVEDV